MNDVTVELIEFMALASGFSREKSKLWRVELYNGNARHSFSSSMCDCRYTNKKHASEKAEYWAKFLGCAVDEYVEETKMIPQTTKKYVEKKNDRTRSNET